MSVRSRRGGQVTLSAGGVAESSDEEPLITKDQPLGVTLRQYSSSDTEVKSKKQCHNTTEIYAVDAIETKRNPLVLRMDDVSQSESASVSDETPPSTPNTPINHTIGIRRRRRSLQDSRVSSSSSPARGFPDLIKCQLYY